MSAAGPAGVRGEEAQRELDHRQAGLIGHGRQLCHGVELGPVGGIVVSKRCFMNAERFVVTSWPPRIAPERRSEARVPSVDQVEIDMVDVQPAQVVVQRGVEPAPGSAAGSRSSPMGGPAAQSRPCKCRPGEIRPGGFRGHYRNRMMERIDPGNAAPAQAGR